MNTSLFKVGLRYWRRRLWQTGLAILGIALGVAVVVAIDLANGSAQRAFMLATEAVSGRATHQIVGGPTGLDEAVYRALRLEQGLRESAPVVEGYVAPLDGGQALRLLGVDPFAEAPFRSYVTTQGTAATGDLTAFLTEPGAVLMSEGLAAARGLAPGDTLTVRVADQRKPLRLVGLLRPADDVSRRALDNLLLSDISTAQETLDMVGKLSHIDLIIDTATPAGQAALVAVQASLPPDARVERSELRNQTVEQLTSAFALNLTALSLLALVVGMFLIYNTMTFSVIQRRAMLGTLRALGVTRGEVATLVLLEAVALGLLGGLLGLGLGIVLGRGAVRLVTQTIRDLYFVVSVQDVTVDPLSLVKGLALGVGAALLATVAPALEATLVAPRSAMSRSNVEARIRRAMPWTTAVGVGLLLAAGLTLAVGGRQLVAGFGGVFLVVLGAAALTPLATVAVMAAVTPVTGVLAGPLGRMAPRTVTRALSRTSVAIAALMVAVSVTIGVGIMIGSFRQTVDSWLSMTLRADVYISTPSLTATRASAALDPALADELAETPGVMAVELARSTTVDTDRGSSNLLALRSYRPRDGRTYKAQAGTPEEVWAQVQAGAALVSEPYAYRHDLMVMTPGLSVEEQARAQVTLRTVRGEATLPIVGIYYDYASDRGTIQIALDRYREWFDDMAVSSVAGYVAPGASADDVTAQLRERYVGRDLVITGNAGLRRAALEVFDRTFAITQALQLLAVVVAFIGVLSALMALQLERTRELGTLRATGMSLREMWGLTMLESGLMGGMAGLLSLPTGLALALILVYIINLRSFGWTLQFQVQPRLFVEAFAVAVVAALLASVYPAIRLGRLQIAEAIRSE